MKSLAEERTTLNSASETFGFDLIWQSMHASTEAKSSLTKKRHRFRFPDVTNPFKNKGHFSKSLRIFPLFFVETSIFTKPNLVFFKFTPIWHAIIPLFFSFRNLAATAGWEIFRKRAISLWDNSEFSTSKDKILLFTSSIFNMDLTQYKIHYCQI